jgi:hypothetical protein
MSFLFDEDRAPAASAPTTQSVLDEPLLPAPLGTRPGDPEIVDRMFKYGIDPLGKILGMGLPIAEKVGGETMEKVSGALGPVGIGISALGALNEGRKVVQTIAEDGPNAIHDPRFYNAEAGVMSNSVHGLLGIGGMIPSPAAPFIKGADALLSATELATDGAGALMGLAFGDKARFDSNSVEGALLRGTMGDKSLGDKTGNWVANQLGPGVGSALAATGVNMLTNMVATPYNLAKTTVDGVSSYVHDGNQAYENGEGYLGEAHKRGVNMFGLREDNPLLMAMSLSQKSHKVGAGLGGGLGLGAGMGGAVRLKR